VHIWEASGRLDVEHGLEAESEKGAAPPAVPLS
jgi:hypothetical protein